MSLQEYKSKRDFTKTKEPKGKKSSAKRKSVFVIQKHDASNLHYDFRLEIDGVMKSWAVPKGLSTDPKEKRLGMPTEDHPMSYNDFEGVIPEGEYGAGTVMIWDRGTFKNIREEKEGDATSLTDSLQEGKLEVWLEGEKLQGGFVLIQTNKGKDEKWMIKKLKDDKADARRNPAGSEPDSVASGRSLKEIEKQES